MSILLSDSKSFSSPPTISYISSQYDNPSYCPHPHCRADLRVWKDVFANDIDEGEHKCGPRGDMQQQCVFIKSMPCYMMDCKDCGIYYEEMPYLLKRRNTE